MGKVFSTAALMWAALYPITGLLALITVQDRFNPYYWLASYAFGFVAIVTLAHIVTK